ncbi:MAG: hypothetical protein A2252_12220 [Elusimicrobia bacterium RIFOXYA2_FULL_39_19]|nr:MAG: hypothetical protein A2252_12220 [Elusimicrobia bacterium RIFOXYA2_FULL_39_19]
MVKNIFAKIAVLPILLISLSVYAQQNPNPLSLEDCIILAEKNNELIQIQIQKIEQAKQVLRQARGALLPEVDFVFVQTLKDTSGSSASGNSTDSKITASQPLFYGFTLKNVVAIAEAQSRVSELELKNVQRALESDTAKAFYALAQAESDLKNTEDTLDKMAEREKVLITRVTIGKSRESELFMLQSQISVLQSNRQKISGVRKKASEQLAFLTGIDAKDIVIADTAMEPSGVDAVESIIDKAQNRSDIKLAEENLRTQEKKIKVAQGLRLPTVDLNGTYYAARSGSMADSKWDTGLSLNMPLYQGGIIKSGISEEKLKLQEYTQALAQSRKRVKTEILQLHSSIESSLAQVSALKSAYSKAQLSYELQLKDYSVGLVNNLDVIQATLTLLDVRNNLNGAIIQSKLNKVLLEIAVK